MSEFIEPLEPVHVVYDYWDGPRSGVANYQGAPHWFENVFNEANDDYSNEFCLIPLPDQALAIAKKSNEIFLRWSKAFNEGTADISQHPALPHERKEYDSLKAKFDTYLETARKHRFKMRGEIQPTGKSKAFETEAYCVRWIQKS